MSHDLSLQGKTFNRWTLLRPDGIMYASSRSAWLAQCQCGTVRRISENNVKRAITKSCGCLQKEQKQQEAAAGAKRRVEYTRWRNMIERCVNPSNKQWHDYGGRGIKVCPEWMAFENFYRDMGEAPDGMTLDRIDTNGDYEPRNCRWSTTTEQNRNKRTNKVLTVDGVSKVQSDWAKDLGVFPALIAARLRLGWSVKDACTKPPSGGKHEVKIKRLSAYLQEATKQCETSSKP